MTSRVLIGQQLVEGGHIDLWQLRSALAHQRCWGGRIGDALVNLGFVAEPLLLTEVARQLGVPYVEIGDRDVDLAVVRLVPEKLIRARNVFPIAYAPKPRRGMLVVATARPQDLAVLDEVAFASGKIVKPALASDRDVEAAIERHLDRPVARPLGANALPGRGSRGGDPLRAA